MGRYAQTSQYAAEENAFWERLREGSGKAFMTRKGLRFSCEVRGNEVFFDRKKKPISRATVTQGYRRARELVCGGRRIKGPRMLEVFGASCLFADLLCWPWIMSVLS